MGSRNILQSVNIERTAQAVAEYYYEAMMIGADEVFTYATEAVRSAANKHALIYRVRELCGEDIEILGKDDEARNGFSGAYDGGVCCVVDMGGASTEIAIGNEAELLYSTSIPYGIVRLTNLEKQGTDLYPFVKGILSQYGGFPKFDGVVAIGGTAGTMASILGKMKIYDPNVANGFEISLGEIEDLYRKLKPMSLDERKRVVGLPEKRADIITSGLLMYGLILKKLEMQKLKVSEGDNMEGYLINKGVLPEGFKAVYTKF